MQYTIISGTNRFESNTLIIAQQYQQLFKEHGAETDCLSLEGVNPISEEEYFKKWQEQHLVATDKFVFVSPEYNGSIPGILKLIIDCSDWKRAWKGKKAMLIGVSTGRAGNLRGMDHLTSILHHMRVHVLPNMLPISQVSRFVNDRVVTDELLLSLMRQQVEEFIAF